MYYTKESIENVKDLDIVDVIGKHVDLKKAGANFQAKSPFKEEKTPSFVVSPAKQIFKCFSTGISGDGISFIQKTKKLEFIEAVEFIAREHNIVLQEEKVTKDIEAKRDKEKDFYKVANFTNDVYVKNYHKLEPQHWAPTYLDKRGYTQEIIIEWGLGYADSNKTIAKATHENGLLGEAKEMNLVKKSENSNTSYDFFRDRITFPIFNEQGSVISFGARIKEKTEGPKYINTSESIIYNKSKELYGLHLAKEFMYKKRFAVLVEGYTDVITMHQYGANTTVATCGTALTLGQAKKLKKRCEVIYLMRDGDMAGFKATYKDVDTLLSVGFDVRYVQLAEKDDPDTFAKRIGAVEDYVLNNYQDAITWKAEQIAKSFINDKYLIAVESLEVEKDNNIELLQQNEVNTSSLEAKELKAAEKFNKTIADDIEALEKQFKADFRGLQKDKINTWQKENGVKEMAVTLAKISSQLIRLESINKVVKVLGVKAQTLKTEIGNIEKRNQELNKGEKVTAEKLGLPKGCTEEHVSFYLKYRFVEFKNQYWFLKGKTIESCSNCVLKPIYHVKGNEINKRVCEVENVHGQRALVDFDSECFTNLSRLKDELIRRGAFVFAGAASTDFDLILGRLVNDFDEAKPLINLGQSADGYYAFSNAVFYKGDLLKTNKHGVVVIDDETEIDAEEDEKAFLQKTPNIYSPSSSIIHKYNQAGDDPYEEDRKFKYIQASMTLEEWIEGMSTVFADRGRISVLFSFAALFRDLFLKYYGNFPLAGGFGEKNSGKSGMGDCIQSLFFVKQEPLNLCQCTQFAFTNRVSKFKNTVAYADEYKESIDERLKTGLMGGFNGYGRAKGSGASSTSVVNNKINAAIYYCGQYIPTFQDNALTQRTLVMLFPNVKYTAEQIDLYNAFRAKCMKGQNGLLIHILKHREEFVKTLVAVNKEANKRLKTKLNGKHAEARITSNYSYLFSTYLILKKHINFPFTETYVEQMLADQILHNQELIQDSDTTTKFWDVLKHLWETYLLREGHQIVIDQKPSFTVYNGKEKVVINNTERKKYLFLRLKAVYEYYSMHCKKTGEEILTQGTLLKYLKDRDYYVGAVKSMNFKSGNSNCIVFDYDKMSNPDTYIASFEKQVNTKDVEEQKTDSSETKFDKDGLPF